MKLEGSNIQTLNKTNLTKDLQLEHRGAGIELNNSARGIRISCSYGSKIVLNGNTLEVLRSDEKLWEFEKPIIGKEEWIKQMNQK